MKFADIDGDGLPDAVVGWEEGGRVRAYLHPGYEGVREPWPSVAVGRVRSPEDAVFADLDGDGRTDVVSACEGKERELFVHWSPPLEQLREGGEWATDAFRRFEPRQWWMQLQPHDLDGDGWIDLFAGSKNAGGSIAWLRNPGRNSARDLGKWEVRRIAEAGWIMSLEILSTPEGDCLAYSDRKGESSGVWLVPLLASSPWTGTPRRIAAAGEEPMFLDFADVDGDGREDLVVAIAPATVRVYRQPEGRPLSDWPRLLELDPLPWNRFGTVKSVRYADLDGDGAGEFAVSCENAREGRCGVLLASRDSSWKAIGGPEGTKFDLVQLVDLDGDGDLDLVTCEERDGLGVVWYENPARRRSAPGLPPQPVPAP